MSAADGAQPRGQIAIRGGSVTAGQDIRLFGGFALHRAGLVPPVAGDQAGLALGWRRRDLGGGNVPIPGLAQLAFRRQVQP
ncbi:hypothetical protein [Chromobacterium piscinae]|uniref:hypothetical protein n=1 Tax=Chromobacterium piscinae TaxID=686831 RepID=UPI003260BB5E